MNDSRVPLRT